jgi:hypothetical protein
MGLGRACTDPKRVGKDLRGACTSLGERCTGLGERCTGLARRGVYGSRKGTHGFFNTMKVFLPRGGKCKM